MMEVHYGGIHGKQENIYFLYFFCTIECYLNSRSWRHFLVLYKIEDSCSTLQLLSGALQITKRVWEDS